MKRSLACLAAVALLSGAGSRAGADQVFYLATGVTAEDNAVVNLLTSEGHTVTVGPQYQNYNGSDLSGYNAVVLLQNNTTIGGEIPAGARPRC